MNFWFGRWQNKKGTGFETRFLPRFPRFTAVLIVSFMLVFSATDPGRAQITLTPNSGTISLSQLIPPNSVSIQIGDKLFSDFQYLPGNSASDPADNLPASAITVSALSNFFGFGISFSGPFAAIGDITKDVVFKYSVTVTDPARAISDVHLGYNGSNMGSGFSHVTEQVFLDGFGGQQIGTLNVMNPGPTAPVFQDVMTLVQPLEKVYIQKDIIFGGGGPGDLNQALWSIVDQTFSQVPEPSTLALVAGGVGLIVRALRRRITPS